LSFPLIVVDKVFKPQNSADEKGTVYAIGKLSHLINRNDVELTEGPSGKQKGTLAGTLSD